MSSCVLVIVHVGDSFPDYLLDCVFQISDVSKAPIHVLASSKHAPRLSACRAVHFPLESLEESGDDDSMLREFHKLSTLDKNFRSGFWTCTSLRFIYLYNHVRALGLEDVFHIEYDNLVYMDFTELLESFRKKSMWAPFLEASRGIGSFMYFRDSNAILELTHQVLASSRVSENDMKALSVHHQNHPDSFGTLPVFRSVSPLHSSHIDEFGCLFDAAASGQFLAGVDPRNCPGDTRGFVNECTPFLKDVTFEWRNGKPWNDGLPMMNLHMHCKNLARYLSSTDFITGEKLQETCDVYCGEKFDFEFNPRILHQRVKHLVISEFASSAWDNPSTVFCYSHRVNDFKAKMLPVAQNPFVLVTHNSDENITDVHVDLLESPKLIAWKAQNPCVKHPKLHLLPIGIANSMWPHGNLSYLQHVRSMCSRVEWKTKDIYFSFSVGTNVGSRSECRNSLIDKLTWTDGKPFAEYLDDLSRHKFCVCPEGNGVDTHRLWESLYLDVIPICKRTTFTVLVHEKFPCVVLVDNWSDVAVESVLPEYPQRYLILQSLQRALQSAFVSTL